MVRMIEPFRRHLPKVAEELKLHRTPVDAAYVSPVAAQFAGEGDFIRRIHLDALFVEHGFDAWQQRRRNAEHPFDDGPVGTGAGPRCRAMCLRRRTRIRTCSPSRRYRRRTRLWFTTQPSRRRSTQIRRNPKRGRAWAISRMRSRRAAWSLARLRRYHAARLNCAGSETPSGSKPSKARRKLSPAPAPTITVAGGVMKYEIPRQAHGAQPPKIKYTDYLEQLAAKEHRDVYVDVYTGLPVSEMEGRKALAGAGACPAPEVPVSPWPVAVARRNPSENLSGPGACRARR